MKELTAEQKLEVIRKGAELNYAIQADLCRDRYGIFQGNSWVTLDFHHTYDTALLALAHIVCPELFATTCDKCGQEIPAKDWEEGWQGFRLGCADIYRGTLMDSSKCKCPAKGKNGCTLYNTKYYALPFELRWHPPTDPATGNPYLTYVAWQAAQAKPASLDLTKVAALIKFASLSPAEQEAQPSISTTALVHDALPELIFMLELVETILEKVAE